LLPWSSDLPGLWFLFALFSSKIPENRKMNLQPSGDRDSKLQWLKFVKGVYKAQLYPNVNCVKDCQHKFPNLLAICWGLTLCLKEPSSHLVAG
jgi:hypothetical protein